MNDARIPRATVETTARLASLQSETVRRWLVQAGSAGANSPDSGPVDRRLVDGSVLSADISGFTRLAERLAGEGIRQAAEALITAINRCFEPMIDEVYRRGGDVLKFGGDAIFVLFEGPEHASQAAKGCFSPAAVHRTRRSGYRSNTFDDRRCCQRPDFGSSLPVPPDESSWFTGTLLTNAFASNPRPNRVKFSSQTETANRISEAWVVEPEPGVLALADSSRVAIGPPSVVAGMDTPTDAASEIGELDGIDWVTVIGEDLAAAIGAFDRTVGEIRVVTVAFVLLPTSDLEDGEVSSVVGRAIDLCARYGATMLSTDVATGGIKILLAAGAPTAGEGDEDAMLATLIDLILDNDAPPMKAGVNRGLIFAGFLGSARCRTFTVMGDPTNLAARLLGKAEMGAIAVSQAVLDHARSHYPTDELPPVMVKGRLQPVTVHQLRGTAAAIRDNKTDQALVGRTEELAELADAWAIARQGNGVVIEIRGESGLGASRMINHFVDGLSGAVPRFTVQGQLNTIGDPYQAVSGFLRAVAGIDDGAGRTEAGDLLTDWVNKLTPEDSYMLPVLAPAFSATVGEPDPIAKTRINDIEPEFRQSVTNGLIVKLLADSLTVPTVIVVEDHKWLDEASLDLLSALAAEAVNHPWMIVSTTRPDGSWLVAHPGPIQSLVLKPLTQSATEQLINSVFDLPSNLLVEVARQSGGNPLFAIELARTVDSSGRSADAGVSVMPDSVTVMPDSIAAMPDSIEGLITSRIDQLGHDTRELVRTAAVLGPSFPLDLLTEIIGRDAGDELSAVDQLFEVDGETGSFRAEVVAQVAYGGLSGRRRAEIHGTVASVLEERRADISQLAWHHTKAGNHRPAWEYSRRSADRAAELGIMSAAADHLNNAIDAATKSLSDSSSPGGEPVVGFDELTEAMASAFDVFARAKRYDEASRFGEQALQRLDNRLDRARLLIRLVTINAEVGGSYQVQVERLTAELDGHQPSPESGDESSDQPSDETWEISAWLKATLAGMYYRLDDMDLAIATADDAIADANLAGKKAPLVPAMRIRHVVLAGRADPERITVGEELIRLATEVDDRRALLSTHNNLGLDLVEDGRWDDATSHFEMAIKQAERLGDEHQKILPAINQAAISVNRGDWDNARTELHELRRETAHYGSGFITAFVQAEIGRLEVNCGRASDGRESLTAALQWFHQAQVHSNVYEVRLSIAAADIADGRPNEAIAGLAELEPPQDLVAQNLGRQQILTGYASMQRGEPEEALIALEEAIAETDGRNRFAYAEALIAAAEAEQFLGLARTARRHRAEGEEILEQLGVLHLPVIPLPK